MPAHSSSSTSQSWGRGWPGATVLVGRALHLPREYFLFPRALDLSGRESGEEKTNKKVWISSWGEESEWVSRDWGRSWGDWAGGARRLSLKDQTLDVAGRGATRSWEVRPGRLSRFEGKECLRSGGKRSEGGRGVRNAWGARSHCFLLTLLQVLRDKGNVHLSKRQLVVSLVFSIVFLVSTSLISTLFFFISSYPLTFP